MREHQRQATENLRRKYEPDPRYLGLIPVGSLVGGTASESSDVDHILVAADAEAARCREAEEVHYYTSEFCDYPGGYVEGKIVDYGFLEAAAERGSEPARSQFVGAQVIFSKVPETADRVVRIPVYPEAEPARRIRVFHAQLLVMPG